MSKRHQSSRRRSYGRRQHEIHERTERPIGFLAGVDETDASTPGSDWSAQAQTPAGTGGLRGRGLD